MARLVWTRGTSDKGSQNGFDNSGERGPINWPYGSNVAYTQQAIQAIITKYSVAPFAGTVVGIELLNEPNGNVIEMFTFPWRC
jgi:glucan 1,3-beta-glucosidase